MWGCVFSVYPFPLWWLREDISLSYYHHQIRSTNYYPCLWLSHETMVCAVCLSIFLLVGKICCIFHMSITWVCIVIDAINIKYITKDALVKYVYFNIPYDTSRRMCHSWRFIPQTCTYTCTCICVCACVYIRGHTTPNASFSIWSEH